jgi:FKBP-type peptidyl-prolyl cis-trans isomerase (trigger factor)
VVLPSGNRWRELRSASVDDGEATQDGQVVRVEYVVRLDDGTVVCPVIASSFRLGSTSGTVCAALEEAALGMRLGETRRLRAAPRSHRGTRVARSAPTGEMLEYDVTLTGVVNNMQIRTLDDMKMTDDPLQALVDLAQRVPARLRALASRAGLVGAASLSQPKKRGRGRDD